MADSDDVVDAAMIFGTGFAPFRGGPLNYARAAARRRSARSWRPAEGKHGERFKPDAGWETFK